MVGAVTGQITPEVIAELLIIDRPKFMVPSGRCESGPQATGRVETRA
jgi:hypothetical protein